MAACALRKLAAQTLRLNILKNSYRCVEATYKRTIHVSTAIQQTFFSNKHEWLDIPDGTSEGTVGITDYAQDKLGDVVFVELPDVGAELQADDAAGVIESVKAASDIFSPVTGTVTAVNGELGATPGMINASPLEKGWLFKLTVTQTEELNDLMSEEEYTKFLADEAE